MRQYSESRQQVDFAGDRNRPSKLSNPETAARIAAEFREMPGLSVTLAQAARLFDLPRDECWQLFGELQSQGIIEMSLDGLYRRPSAE